MEESDMHDESAAGAHPVRRPAASGLYPSNVSLSTLRSISLLTRIPAELVERSERTGASSKKAPWEVDGRAGIDAAASAPSRGHHGEGAEAGQDGEASGAVRAGKGRMMLLHELTALRGR
jgi:hypothetical protein